MKVFRERGESISGNVNSARRNFHSTSTEDGHFGPFLEAEIGEEKVGNGQYQRYREERKEQGEDHLVPKHVERSGCFGHGSHSNENSMGETRNAGVKFCDMCLDRLKVGKNCG